MKFLLLLWIFVPYLAIFLMKHFKSTMYMFGFIPAIVIIISLWYSCLKSKKTKIIVLIIFVLCGLLQYVNFSYTSEYSLINSTYYNKNNGNIFNDTKDVDEFLIRVISYIKKICNDDIIFIWTLDEPLIRYANFLRILMYLNNIKYKDSDIIYFDNVNDVLNCKYILILGENKTISEELLNKFLTLYELINLNYSTVKEFNNNREHVLKKGSILIRNF